MRRDLVSAVLTIILITAVFGVVYPLAVTGAAHVVFPGRAGGSTVTRDGTVVGSRLLAQDFKGLRRYFQERPSTATHYAPDATAFTNLGPNSRDARATFVRSLRAYVGRERPFTPGLTTRDVPVDAVTSSASGVDPHISPANAAIQAHRVARARHLPLSQVRQLIDEHTDGRSLGVLGEPGVNVLELNLALDARSAS